MDLENEILNVALEESAECAPEEGKKRKRKWWIWLIVAAVIVGILLCAIPLIKSYQEALAEERFIAEGNKCIEIVKNTQLSSEGHTYGEILETVYTDFQWSYVGEGIVEFKGTVSIGSETRDIYRFAVDIEAGKTETVQLSVDGVEKNGWDTRVYHTYIGFLFSFIHSEGK